MKGLNPHFHKAIPTEEDCRRIKAQEAHYRPILEKIFAEHFLKLVKSILKENKMQEIMQDGSEGESHVADSIEDLVPHIKKSLAKPDVKFVKVFKARGPIKNEEVFSTEEQKSSPLDELVEKYEEAKDEQVKLFVEFKKPNIEIRSEDGEISIGIPYRFDIQYGERNLRDLLEKLGFNVEIKK